MNLPPATWWWRPCAPIAQLRGASAGSTAAVLAAFQAADLSSRVNSVSRSQRAAKRTYSSPARGGVTSSVEMAVRVCSEGAVCAIVWVMSVLELSDEQVIALVRQLPAARRRTALLALAQDSQGHREERLRFGE